MGAFDLCLVLASQSTPEITGRCLETLLAQDLPRSRLQIIVAEGPPYLCCESLVARFETVTFLRAPDQSIPTLHGLGIAAANANLIAISEGHCTFPSNWAESAIAAHQGNDAAAIGGAVMPGAGLNAINKGLFLCDYAQFVEPISAGPNIDLPGNNVVFKSDRLKDIKQFSQSGFWKTFYCHRLAHRGEQLYAEPSLLVYYNRHLTMAELVARRYHHGRCFGAMRAESAGTLKKFIYLLSGPALPLVLAYKLIKRCAGKPYCRSLLIANSPAAILSIFLWSVGEWSGNLFGSGASCTKL